MLAPLQLLQTARRHVLIRRRPLAAVCVALAVWCGVKVVTAPPPPTVPLWTATRDLPSGTTLATDDFRRTGFAPGSVPAAAVRDRRALVGRTLVGPLGRGQVAVTSQVLGPSALAGYPGRSALGLRIPDVGAAAMLDPGDRVDLLASDLQKPAAADLLVEDAVVLAVPPTDPDDARAGTPAAGRLILFAVPSEDVAQVATAGVTHYLSVVWNR